MNEDSHYFSFWKDIMKIILQKQWFQQNKAKLLDFCPMLSESKACLLIRKPFAIACPHGLSCLLISISSDANLSLVSKLYRDSENTVFKTHPYSHTKRETDQLLRNLLIFKYLICARHYSKMFLWINTINHPFERKLLFFFQVFSFFSQAHSMK